MQKYIQRRGSACREQEAKRDVGAEVFAERTLRRLKQVTYPKNSPYDAKRNWENHSDEGKPGMPFLVRSREEISGPIMD